MSPARLAAIIGVSWFGLASVGVAYDDFESYTNGQVLATTTSNIVAGSQWGRFGAATSSNPYAVTNAGTSGSVAADYPLNWSLGNNGNLEFWFYDTLVLTSAPGVSVNLRVDTQVLSNTVVEAAFEQTDGSIWQTTVGQVLTNTTYMNFVFNFTSNLMTETSGSGTFNLKIVKDLRLRFVNNGGTGTQQVYVDDCGAVTSTNQMLLTSRGLFTQNAIWLSSGYTYSNQMVNLVPSLAQNMQYLDKVTYWFVNATTVGTNGVLNDPGFQFSQLTNFLDAVNSWEIQHGHRFVLEAWLNATINPPGLDVTNPTVRSNLVVECEKLVSTTVPGSYVAKAKRTFDGVHFDFEPSGGDSNIFNGLLLLMDQTRAGFTSVGLTNGGYISFASERFQANSSSTARWTQDNYYQMGQKVNSLGVMLYDTTITSPSQFQGVVCDNTTSVVQSVSGAYWHNDPAHPAPTNHPLVYMGFAAYPTDSEHSPSTENVTNAALGADLGVTALINRGDPSVNYFGGAIVFDQTDGTGNDGSASYTNDWERFQEYWLWGCLDCSLGASFTYTINTTNSPSGGGSTSGGGTVSYGSNVTVCATANTCYSFVNWTVNSTVVSTSACYTFTAVTNEALVANFSPIASYTITTSSSPSAGGSTSGGGTVGCGSAVTVCATPNACYNFVNWTDQSNNVLSTSACDMFTPNANSNLVAHFVVVSPYTISTTNSPPGGGSTTGGGTVACGSNVTVCAMPNACYSFVNWTDQNSNVVDTSVCFTFTAAGNQTLVANFAVNGLPISGSLTTLWTFSNGVDGANSYATMMQGSDGNLYGTTYGSGVGASANGAVFRITPGGSLTNLHSFVGSDGANPFAGLVQGTDGNFYGTTYDGGVNGYGTVFRVNAGGSLTTLWTFTNGMDGANSYATMVQGSDGNFYGTTYGSGSGPSANGTVFRISAGGSLSSLWSFTGGTDGANPGAGLVEGSDGNFYGTTYAGGSGYGTVFRITTGGSLATLWSFTNGVDGANSYATLVQGVDGNFYGTTSGSGSGPGANGTVFRITPSGNMTNLWEFTGCGDGGSPSAGLMQGSDGNFYGTTAGSGSGPSANGSVFRISPTGSLTVLHFFVGSDGYNPNATLVQGIDGSFYGTTTYGANGYGTVFQFSVPLNPPANQISAIQMGGSNVVLILPSVAGETYQLQFSSSMDPTNWINVTGGAISNCIGGPLSLTNFGGALQPQGVYRFDITP
jgi:uncharacterized repeat protein (TIGR03803 family)